MRRRSKRGSATTRADIKQQVMSEHNDRSGKIFKQVLARANDKLRDVAGLELVLTDQVVGLRRGEVLLMCQDLGYVDLMRYVLAQMWARDVED